MINLFIFSRVGRKLFLQLWTEASLCEFLEALRLQYLQQAGGEQRLPEQSRMKGAAPLWAGGALGVGSMRQTPTAGAPRHIIHPAAGV